MQRLSITNAAGRALSVAYTNTGLYNVGYAVTLPGGSVFRREVRRDPSYPDRITACSNFFDSAAMTGFVYHYDLAGRPTTLGDISWGPDLSGTLQGAGGVGGLVAVSIAGQYYFPCYDNLGNIVAYVDESGVKVASYTYDAFGYTLSSSGTKQGYFPHRFSTKYRDEFSGFYDYGYRWYWPEYGRWLSRDPIGEMEGRNLYCFARNMPSHIFDILGLYENMISVPDDFATYINIAGLDYGIPTADSYMLSRTSIFGISAQPTTVSRPAPAPQKPCYFTLVGVKLRNSEYFDAITKTKFSLLIAAPIPSTGSIESAEIPLPFSSTGWQRYRFGTDGICPNVPCKVEYTCVASCHPCAGCPSSKDKSIEVFRKTLLGKTSSNMQRWASYLGSPNYLRMLGYTDNDIWTSAECVIPSTILENARSECKQKAETSCNPNP